MVFCHYRLIAHRVRTFLLFVRLVEADSRQDFSSENFVFNHAPGPVQPYSKTGSTQPPAALNSLFPLRFYLIDFEYAVSFSAETPDAERTVRGPPGMEPTGRFIYTRPLPSEAQAEAPYCPFRADVWQIGLMLQEQFEVCGFSEALSLCDDVLVCPGRSLSCLAPTFLQND